MITQQDKLGQDLAVNDIVVVPHTKTELVFGRVIKLTAKGARLAIKYPHRNQRTKEITMLDSEVIKKANAIVKLTNDDVVMIKLKGFL